MMVDASKFREAGRRIKKMVSDKNFQSSFSYHFMLGQFATHLVHAIDNMGGEEKLNEIAEGEVDLVSMIKEELLANVSEQQVSKVLDQYSDYLELFGPGDSDILISKIGAKNSTYSKILTANRKWFQEQVRSLFEEIREVD